MDLKYEYMDLKYKISVQTVIVTDFACEVLNIIT